jgi:hypothetical protein
VLTAVEDCCLFMHAAQSQYLTTRSSWISKATPSVWSGRRWIRAPSLNLGGTQVAAVPIMPTGDVIAAATGRNGDGTSYPLLQRWRPPPT